MISITTDFFLEQSTEIQQEKEEDREKSSEAYQTDYFSILEKKFLTYDRWECLIFHLCSCIKTNTNFPIYENFAKLNVWSNR